MNQVGKSANSFKDMPVWHITKSIQEYFSGQEMPKHWQDQLIRINHKRKRFTLSEDEGTGYYEFVHLNEELMLLVCKRNLHHDFAMKLVCDGFLKVHFRISGTADVVLSDGNSFAVNGLYCGMMTQPVGVSNGAYFHAGNDEKWGTIFCGPNQLLELLGDQVSKLPKLLLAFTENNAMDIFNCQLPMQPAMTYALSSIINPKVGQALEPLHTEAAVLELLSLALNEVIEEKRDTQAIKLSSKDISRLQEVREILCVNYADPPEVQQLANLIGINQGKLNAGFKTLFGLTISKFVTQCRMKEAQRLLEEGELNITQVGQWVGYEYSSNFSTAFKRYFGVAPKDITTAL